MARPKVEINMIRCERLKQICIEQHITQKELNHLTGITQQAISKMVTGQANVTETTAYAVIKAFPQYRFEWLMGYDEIRTVTELNRLRNLNALNLARKQSELLFIGLGCFATLSEYAIVSPFDEHDEHRGNAEAIIEKVKSGYTIEKNGSSISLSLEELNELENEVCDYAEYRLERLFRKKGERSNG